MESMLSTAIITGVVFVGMAAIFWVAQAVTKAIKPLRFTYCPKCSYKHLPPPGETTIACKCGELISVQ